MIGLYKAIRDYRVDRESSFRSFAELCITRQIITAIKGATRFKHAPLNGYVSFSHTPAGPGPRLRRVHARRRARRLARSPTPAAGHLQRGARRRWSACSARASRSSRRRSSRGSSRASRTSRSRDSAGCDAKAVDNALQRVKRKVGSHLADRAAL